MRLSTETIARASARHPWRTTGAWLLALLIAVGLVVTLLGDALTTEGDVTNDPESERAYELMVERFPPDPDFVTELVVVRSATLTVDDAAFRRKVEELAEAIRATGAVRTAASHYESGDRSLVSGDRHAALIPVGLGFDPEAGVEDVIEVAEEAGGGGFDVSVTGEVALDRDINRILDDDLRTGELYFGGPAALVILVLVFGALLAAVVPLALALVSITVALGLAALVGQAFELSVFIFNMLTVMGLAIGVDYSLFVLSRYREERTAGRDELESIATAGATASRAVLFSGLAFVLAMTGMLFVPDTVLRSLAVGAILVGIVSVVAALTLLPAVLGLLGDRVNALRVPLVGRTEGGEGRFWSGVARTVTRRPVVSLTAAVVLLLGAAAPVVDIDIGSSGIRSLPDEMPSKQGFVALEEAFGVGTLDSVLVVVDGDVESSPVRAAIERLTQRLESSPAFRNPAVETSPAGDLAVVEALVAGDSRDLRTVTAVERLRSEDVPEAFAGADADVLVTGETAEEIDYVAVIDRWLPVIFAFVLGLSLVLLTIAFRSIVIPLKAVVLNLLSVAAAFGMVVLVFQKGVGNELFGFVQTEQITPWLPPFLFSVLFGLSMDYHVFLLSRIREWFIRTGDSSEAVVHGVGSTARVITGAALIIIAVFAGFASGDLVETQQVGFGVAIALLIDATIVRSVLVPASMELLGRWNWYLPSWLRWLPDVHVEGPGA
ncbi:MAG: MMPL family transporter [Gaiellaceae bacterium]